MAGLVKIFTKLNFVQSSGLFVCVGSGIYWAGLNIIFFLQYFAIFGLHVLVIAPVVGLI